MSFTYSVAIRTLGLGGEKYVRELKSIAAQTLQPEKVVVYIAERYEIPSFRIGKEEYVTVPKGMVAQRALDYHEIDSPYILLLDDDVFLPNDGVETLARELRENDGDVIAADVFKPQQNTWRGIVRDYVTSMFYPHRSDEWAFKVLRNASCSYNGRPEPRAYLSQTAAGPASLWKKSTMLAIHYQDELWLDRMGFAWGDDQLMFYKVHRNGFRLLVSYDSGIEHLDAKSASTGFSKSSDRLYKRSMAQYLLWYRSCYSPSDKRNMEKLLCKISFSMKTFMGLAVHCAYAIVKMQPSAVTAFVKGIADGRRKAKEELDKLPNYIIEK